MGFAIGDTELFSSYSTKSSLKYCTYYDICPSASDWCKNRQASSECLPFLNNAEGELNRKIHTLYSIKRYIEVNEE